MEQLICNRSLIVNKPSILAENKLWMSYWVFSRCLVVFNISVWNFWPYSLFCTTVVTGGLPTCDGHGSDDNPLSDARGPRKKHQDSVDQVWGKSGERQQRCGGPNGLHRKSSIVRKERTACSSRDGTEQVLVRSILGDQSWLNSPWSALWPRHCFFCLLSWVADRLDRLSFMLYYTSIMLCVLYIMYQWRSCSLGVVSRNCTYILFKQKLSRHALVYVCVYEIYF